MMAKVIVGMSGGVDSAVAAYLLKVAGYDVIGVTLRTWVSSTGKDSRCCEIDDARRIAWHLDIPYHVISCRTEFREMITDPFIQEYLQGRTPNPCVICNQKIKWEKMMEAAGVMQADYIATGHYASIVSLESGRYTVQKSLYAPKDQTYMLYRLTQEQLRRTILPLGKLSKDEVRKIAERVGLPVAAKPDSQEICFVTDGDYVDYIEQNAEQEIPGEGFFVDTDGNRLGRHRGIIHYTVGQRKGLGLALGYPAYVKEIRTDTNEVVIGTEEELYRSRIYCDQLNYLSIAGLQTGERIRANVKIRYHHAAAPAWITLVEPDLAAVDFDSPVRAAAPGQSAVFYDGQDCVIGGGVIQK
ncbi:MAG: tRNA 2-thiouridine(34) synthase MnmA [Lachnospiraceae bacterium]|nr:tRNA 2-thiouridine(34) synthase MnmA [Lachnospiraceae bacterium]